MGRALLLLALALGCGSSSPPASSGGSGGGSAGSGGTAGGGSGGSAPDAAATGGSGGLSMPDGGRMDMRLPGGGGLGGGAGGMGGLGGATGGSGGSGGATGADAGVPSDAGSVPTALQLTLTLHLENKTFDAAYFTSLDNFAKSFESHGGRLTFEPRNEVVMAAAGPPMLLDWKTLEGRGHAVGSHAGIGGTTPIAVQAFTLQARMRYEQLAPRVLRLDHISGNCGNVDWVKGVVDAGFSATTAATVLCLYSMAPADRPAPYMNLDCSGATDPVCHKPYPSELPARMHPWRAASGAKWLTDDPAGKLVIFPGSGTLPCLEEEATTSGPGLPMCTFTMADVTRALADLDVALGMLDPNRLNTFYWVWGSWSLSATEQPVLDAFLTAIDQRVATGKLQWSNLGRMHDHYKEWEKTHR